MHVLHQYVTTPQLRRRALVVLGLIVLYRVGSFIPLPGVDYTAVSDCAAKTTNEDFVGLVNLFSGGAMLQLSIFALGVMPYINASIIIQLLRGVIPKFEALHREGQAGDAKLTQYTRYLTIALALFQAVTVLVTARSGALFDYMCTKPVISDGSWLNLVIMTLIMTGASGFIMWMAELITDHGIGQGMSILIFSSICAGFIPKLWSIGYGTNGSNGSWKNFAIIVATLLVVFLFVDYIELIQRRIPVRYTRNMMTQATQGGSYLPFRLNMSGVIPPIFAASILSVPTLIARFGNENMSWVKWTNENLGSTVSSWYIWLYVVLIVFFCYFYTSIQFNTTDISDNLRQSGGFIPGIKSGRATVQYLDYVLHRLDTSGAAYLVIVSLVPTLLIKSLGLSSTLPFGATTLLIIAGTGLDTLRQAVGHADTWSYEPFISGVKVKLADYHE